MPVALNPAPPSAAGATHGKRKSQTADNPEEGWHYCQGDKNARRPPELLTRDHVARCIVREIKEGRASPHGGVFLDISWIKSKLPNAAEHIKLSANLGPATVSFQGNATTKVIAANPHSGLGYWYSNRRDSGDATLTREVDLGRVVNVDRIGARSAGLDGEVILDRRDAVVVQLEPNRDGLFRRQIRQAGDILRGGKENVRIGGGPTPGDVIQVLDAGDGKLGGGGAGARIVLEMVVPDRLVQNVAVEGLGDLEESLQVGVGLLPLRRRCLVVVLGHLGDVAGVMLADRVENAHGVLADERYRRAVGRRFARPWHG